MSTAVACRSWRPVRHWTTSEFLEDHYGVMRPADADAEDTERFLAAVAGGLSDDFPDDITDEDLAADAPHRRLG